jgi:hypothetical protein
MVGVLVQNEGTDATIEDLVVRRTRPGVVFGGARGIEINGGPTARCTRCLVEEVREFGASSDMGSDLTLTDVVVRNVTARAEDDRAGRGLSVQGGGRLAVSRVAILDALEAGIFVDGSESRVTGQDVTVRRIAPDIGTGSFGRGLTVQYGAGMELARVEILEVHEGGIAATEAGAFMHMTDLLVRDVRARPSDQRFGRGVIGQVGVDVTLERAHIDQVREFGVGAMRDATITLNDVRVSNVLAQDCATAGCDDQPGGHGLGSYFSAQISAQSFEIVEASLCGIQVAEGGTVSLREGLVTGASIGACLQNDMQNVSDLQDDVVYVGNDRNLEATMLPVPGPLDNLE